MARVRRSDSSRLGRAEKTPQGGYRIPSTPTRVGVFEYLRPDGTIRREYRPPEEVFSPGSLASLAHAPVTDLHPEREGVRIPVTPENYKDLAVGHVAEDVRQDGTHVAASLLIQDADTLLKIEAGDREELSCGYSCELDPTPGVTSAGEIYDAIQRGIRYNHVALGPRNWGRAGSTVALRLDSDDAIQAQREDQEMEKEIIDGKEYVVGSPEWIAAKKAQTTKLSADLDATRGRADAAEKALEKAKADKPDPKAQAEAVTRRVRLVLDCKRVALKTGARFDEVAAAGMAEGDMIVQAIKALDPTFDVEGKSPDYLMGAFMTMIKGLQGEESAEGEGETPAPPGNTTMGGNPTAGENKTDSGAGKTIFQAREGQGAQNRADNGPDPDKARKALAEKNKARGTGPLTAHK